MSNPNTQATTAEDASTTQSDASASSQYEFQPAVKVILIQFGLLAGIGLVVLALIGTNPGPLGGQQVANILLLVTGFVLALALLRLLVRMYVLRRTRYVITAHRLRREYAFFYKRRSREVPLAQLRGMELEQDRLQTILGYGDVTFLTAGTNQSLGFMEFENVNDPGRVRDEIRDIMPE